MPAMVLVSAGIVNGAITVFFVWVIKAWIRHYFVVHSLGQQDDRIGQHTLVLIAS
jgi:hypothetical protein